MSTTAISRKVQERNTRIDALAQKFEELTRRELDRIDKQVAFLRLVQKGRGAGKLKSRADLGMRVIVAEKIEDFLS